MAKAFLHHTPKIYDEATDFVEWALPTIPSKAQSAIIKSPIFLLGLKPSFFLKTRFLPSTPSQDEIFNHKIEDSPD